MKTFSVFLANRKWLAALLLLGSTIALYHPVTNYEFVDLDDDVYITDNHRVQQGLTWSNVLWAFKTLDAAFWHPLTWLSHLVDYELFGLNPAGHHLMNLLVHSLNVVLLFWVVQQLTGAVWKSVLVAALFALHPLNVESVAWVAERKNLLSTSFWILTLGLYAAYVRRPGRARYWGTVVLFVLGLMSKPMLVTLPCVLLLLDYWPLERMGYRWSELRRHFFPLFREKIPLFLIALAFGLLAVFAQQRFGAMPGLQELSFHARVSNALVSYTSYLTKMLWPTSLVVYYPHPGESLTPWAVLGSLLVLLCISGFALRARRRFPYLFVGWFWYLGTLFPVSGIIQVGSHAMADRYAYVPLIGLFILLVWGLADTLRHAPLMRLLQAPVAVCLLFLLALNARLQLGYWQNGITLLEHAVRSTEDNYIAHNNLGTALLERGRVKGSIEHFGRALEIKPDSSIVLFNLGLALKRNNRLADAAHYFSKSVELNPDLAEAHNHLGMISMSQGELEEAIQHFQTALRIDAGLASAHNNLAGVFDLRGQRQKAREHYTRALQLSPDAYLAHNNLGLLLYEEKAFTQAARHFVRAIEARPDFSEAYRNLGLIRMEQGRKEEAVSSLERALELNPEDGRAREALRRASREERK